MQTWLRVVAVSIVLCLTAAPSAQCQAQDATALHFDVVSIRPSNAGPREEHLTITPDGYEAIGYALQSTLLLAYAPAPFFKHLDDIKGLPSWAKSERYDIRAKLAAKDIEHWKQLDQSIMRTPPLLQAMLRQVLQERCNLRIHSEDTKRDVFTLRLAARSPALIEDSSVPPGGEGNKLLDGARFLFSKENGELTYTFYNTSMSVLANFISIPSAHPVVDRTGLQGRYKFVLRRLVNQSQDASGTEPQVDMPVPYDLRAIGLTIGKDKEDGKVWVVDSIQKPTEN